MLYLIITEQREIDARNHRNSDVELRARQAVELLHGECCLSKVQSCCFWSKRIEQDVAYHKYAKKKEKHG
jgi:hypothetical protein